MSSLGDFTFHDLRHCAINNLRLAGNDHFAIKKISGHKTDSAFQRYNLVTEEEMKGMKWLEEKRRIFKNDGHLYGHYSLNYKIREWFNPL